MTNILTNEMCGRNNCDLCKELNDIFAEIKSITGTHDIAFKHAKVFNH